MIDRPHEVKAHHLVRKAAIYVRQSTDTQVTNNRGSTEYQRAQQRHAAAWGWSEHQIEVIDEDLGRTGTATAHRSGYQRLLRELDCQQIGAVFVSDESRLGREPIALFEFANKILACKALLVVDGRVIDLTDSGSFFHSRLNAILNEFDNRKRREHIRRGIEARIAAGKAVTRPPAGYVSGPDGAWDLDPDPLVRNAITAVFRLFQERHSCPLVVRGMLEMGLRLPRRRWARTLEWVPPTAGGVAVILKNPRYTDRYVYRLQVSDPSRGVGPRGYPRVRAAKPEETTIVQGHHAPYVSFADWTRIQEILREHALTAHRINPGPGSALLQGILRCSHHPHRTMSVGYKRASRSGRRPHYYRCLGEYLRGGDKCWRFAGGPIDRAVVASILARLSRPSVQALRAAWNALLHDRLDGQRVRMSVLEQARCRVVNLEQRYMLVDPTHRLVADSLEAQLEHAKRELQRLERQPDPADQHRKLTASDFDELLGLSDNLADVFHAPTTRWSDRKEIVRLLIAQIAITSVSKTQIHCQVAWTDGDSSHLTAFTDAGTRQAILAAVDSGLTTQQAADWANRQNLVTRQAGRWSAAAVRDLRLARRIRATMPRTEFIPAQRGRSKTVLQA